MSVAVHRRASFVLVAMVAAFSVLFVTTTQDYAEALVPAAPFVPVIPELGGTTTVVGGSVAAEGATGVCVSSGGCAALLAAGVGVYGVGWLTYQGLDWLFGSPETAGVQPKMVLGSDLKTPSQYGKERGTFTNAVTSPTAPVNQPWTLAMRCNAGTTNVADSTAGWSNTYGTTCFTTMNAPAYGSTGQSISVGTPAWRCKTTASACGSAVAMRQIKLSDYATTGFGYFSGFSSLAGAAGTHTFGPITMGGTSCSGIPTGGGSGWTSLGACQDAYSADGWELWYDPTLVEWAPPPQHSLQSSVTCKNLATGALTTTTRTTSNFYETDAPPNVLSTLGCSSGSVATHTSIMLCGPAGSGCASTIYDWTASPRTITPSPTDPYRDCLPGGVAAPCQVKLAKIVPDGSFVTCNANTDCSTFDSAASDPSQWRCTWGSYVVPIAQCAPLQVWAGTTGSNAATDPYPSPTTTTTGTATATATAGATPSGSSSLPTTGTNPGVDPTPGTSTAPDNSSCWGTGWSWDPISWVYTPVKCVLQWAFVPPTSAFADQMSSVGNSFAATGVGSWFAAFQPLVTAAGQGGAGDCLGPEWAFDAVGQHFSLHPFSACASPQADLAVVVRTGLTVVVWLGAAVVCMRLIGASVGLNLNGLGGKDEEA